MRFGRMKLLGVFLVGVFLVSVAVTLSAGAQQPGGVLRAAMTTNPPTLDPHMSVVVALRQTSIYMFESLFTYGEDFDVIPQLVDTWEVSEDGLVYTFRLRAGVKFHNGDVLTADDVKASLDRYRAVSPGAYRLDAVAAINVIDALTVEMRLSRETALLPNLAMLNPLMAIFPSEVIKDRITEVRGEELIGTGPYRFVEWRPDVWLRLKRFDEYVPDPRFEGPSGAGGKRTPYFDEIYLIPVPEAASRLAGLETGTYDYAEALPITAYEGLRNNPDVLTFISLMNWGPILEINASEPPTDNVLFRRAIVAALDMEKVMQAVAMGKAAFYRMQPSYMFPEQEVWWNDAGSEIYNRRDLAKVQDLLRQAGYNKEPVVFISNKDYDWMYRCSLAVAAQLAEAGINVVLEFMDWPSSWQKAMTGKGWNIVQSGLSPRLDPLELGYSFLCGVPTSFGYCDSAVDQLFKRLDCSNCSVQDRQDLFRELQQLLWESARLPRLGDFGKLEGVRAEVHGYRPWYITPRFWDCWKG